MAVLVAVICLAAAASAVAADRSAKKMIAGSMNDRAALLSKIPSLAKVDDAIRSDCAARNEGQPAASDFCVCASAVTLSLWRSGADPKMMPRLNAYLEDPTERAAAALLEFQGPELYRPICTAATKH
jgi:hypothetical protein